MGLKSNSVRGGAREGESWVGSESRSQHKGGSVLEVGGPVAISGGPGAEGQFVTAHGGTLEMCAH